MKNLFAVTLLLISTLALANTPTKADVESAIILGVSMATRAYIPEANETAPLMTAEPLNMHMGSKIMDLRMCWDQSCETITFFIGQYPGWIVPANDKLLHILQFIEGAISTLYTPTQQVAPEFSCNNLVYDPDRSGWVCADNFLRSR